jgi:hypothetical protein
MNKECVQKEVLFLRLTEALFLTWLRNLYIIPKTRQYAIKASFSSRVQSFGVLHRVSRGDVAWGVQILIKKQITESISNRETNLLSLINTSLAHVLL